MDDEARPEWCGQCDRENRQFSTPDGLQRCPACHPLSGRHLRQYKTCPACLQLIPAWDRNPCGFHIAAPGRQPGTTQEQHMTETPGPDAKRLSTGEYLQHITAQRHPSVRDIAQWFTFEHLPANLPQHASAACADLAANMLEELPDSPELTTGLRKLLEAKDCFVRAAIAAQPLSPGQPGSKA